MITVVHNDIDGCGLVELKEIECSLIDEGYTNIEIDSDGGAYLVGEKERELNEKERTELYQKRYDTWWFKTMAELTKELDIDRCSYDSRVFNDIKDKCKNQYSMEVLCFISRNTWKID